MTDPLYSDLPGAPPPGDPGHQPYQAPDGKIPDATPYAPRAVNPADLTPVQKHAMRQAISSGSREQYEAFLNSLDGQPNAGAPEVSPPSAPPAAPAPAAEEPAPSPERAALAEQLEAHGSHIEALDTLQPRIDDFSLSLEGLTDEDRYAVLVAGDEQVLAKLYRGSDAAMAAGVGEIREAVKMVGGDALIKAIDETGVLTDPALHQRILLMARNVLSNRGAQP